MGLSFHFLGERVAEHKGQDQQKRIGNQAP